ncbi:MAG: hypothetical protein IPP25_12955 [Saprospiraceae bacterium]|nr:hypothetical protein [Candidatus Opimibacter skivensis]
MASQQVPDKRLIERFRTGSDRDALGTLFLRYMELVYGVCLKYLGQPEAAQDAVMDIYEHLNRKLLAMRWTISVDGSIWSARTIASSYYARKAIS